MKKEHMLAERLEEILQSGQWPVKDRSLLAAATAYLKEDFQEVVRIAENDAVFRKEFPSFLAHSRVMLGDAAGMKNVLNEALLSGTAMQEVNRIYASILRKSEKTFPADVLEAYGVGTKSRIAEKVLLAIRSRKYNDAIRIADKASDSNGEYWNVQLLKAYALALMGRHEEADQLVQACNAKLPEEEELFKRQICGQIGLLSGDYEGVITCIGEADFIPSLAILKLKAFVALGRTQEIEALLRVLPPEDICLEDRIETARALLHFQMYQQAKVFLAIEDDVVQGSDGWFKLRYYQALYQRVSGDAMTADQACEELIQDCIKAYIREPRRANLYMIQAACYRDMGNQEKTKEAYDFLKMLYPDDRFIEALQ